MMQRFGADDWRKYVPTPICGVNSAFSVLYEKAWELAYEHIKNVGGMHQTPYMDEAFCETQIWIWDSCFMALFCKFARTVFPGVETLNNFYEVLYNGKSLPEIIPKKEEPDWTGAACGEPCEMKVHIADNPPLFAWAEYENALMSGDVDYVKELLCEKKFLQKHYEWIENLRKTETLEGVYAPTCLIALKDGYKWEGGRSGMDNSPRGRIGKHAVGQRPNNPDMLWLDAICQQALSARMISRMFGIIGDSENEAKWNSRFLEKKEIINRLYWDDEDGFYYDIDCNTHGFYKVMTIASFWAMTAEVATGQAAECLAKRLSDACAFGGEIPLVSLSRGDADFRADGEYWRGSVWLPTAYAALKGLANYGYYEDARILARRLLEHMNKTCEEFEPHTIWECYSPTEAKPAINEFRDGYVRCDFCGWSALGPISVYIEFVIGFHKIDAFEKIVEWAKPDSVKSKIGIENLRFGNVVTDITAIGERCHVISNEPYTLKINGKEYKISEGINEFSI